MKSSKTVLSFLLILLAVVFGGTLVTAAAADTSILCTVGQDGGITMKLTGLYEGVYGVQLDFTVNGVYDGGSFETADKGFAAYETVKPGNSKTDVSLYITAKGKMNTETELVLGTLRLGNGGISKAALPSSMTLIMLNHDLKDTQMQISVNQKSGGSSVFPWEDVENKTSIGISDKDFPGTLVWLRSVIENTTASASMPEDIVDDVIRHVVDNESENLTIAPAATTVSADGDKVIITVPSRLISELSGKTDAGLVVKSPRGRLIIQNPGLDSIAGKEETVITIGKGGGASYVDIKRDGESVNSVQGGITLIVPCSDCGLGTVAAVISENGERSVVRKSVADTENYTVTVPLEGSCKIEIINNSTVFNDVPDEKWMTDAIAFVSGHELFNGVGDNRFAPKSTMTRGMLAKVMHNWESNPDMELSGVFKDVDSEKYYAAAVEWAAEAGIVSGYGDGTFGPENPVKREQLATILYRHAGKPEADNDFYGFNDVSEISDYALPAMRWAVSEGIIGGKGDGRLDPGGNATRAEVAAMIMRYIA